MNLKLRGKAALVTGSSRGIGLATAKAFAAEGCGVMLSARSTEQMREAETALRATGYYEDYVRHGFPMGRLGSAEEVADVIVFIASPRAHWINGRNIPVDGLEQPHAPADRRPY
jgi:NAD(P)-dependent dehydrogenase (short-subunit alcohol dehydrogenase family)